MTKSKNTLELDLDLTPLFIQNSGKFRTAYDGLQTEFSDITGTDFIVDADDAEYHPSRSLTIQADAHDLDINNIMARYLKTGLVPATRAQAFFGDASALPDFQEAQQIIIDANLAFENLPAKVRDRFLNDPARFLEFMGDTANRQEAFDLGLMEAFEPPAAVAERPQEAGVAKAAPAPSEGQE